ncbi:DUF4115 domain-containing protein [Synechococcales cyanobacterium C]|uniref:DUF4115 domain-containing protein n=1 Tax=Petrachloros mirabilis ULC683 TaxID=2781853 RepID=A0A8K2A1W3_9CYAN|nr:RodZ domain-containing protein [Petrachloros mirabilis]NCJ08168.1 DUF4115 domain-containing protein [Petrachloros mirabilis ULC683]
MSSPEFEQEQSRKLADIGAELRRAREQQGKSLEDIAAKTLIQQRMLKAIEAGKLEQLPEPVYVKGFIRRYADALALNGTKLADLFPVSAAFAPSKEQLKAQPPIAVDSLRPVHLWLLYVVVIIAAVSGLSYYLSRDPNPSDSAPSVSTPEPSEVEAPPPPEPTPPPPVQEAPVEVVLTFNEDSWAAFTLDGRADFEGIVSAGETRTLTGQTQIEVVVGNAGGVLAAVNNQAAAPMGSAGTIAELVATPP